MGVFNEFVLQFLAAVLNLRVNCEKIVGDRQRQPADEIFITKR